MGFSAFFFLVRRRRNTGFRGYFQNVTRYNSHFFTFSFYLLYTRVYRIRNVFLFVFYAFLHCFRPIAMKLSEVFYCSAAKISGKDYILSYVHVIIAEYARRVSSSITHLFIARFAWSQFFRATLKNAIFFDLDKCSGHSRQKFSLRNTIFPIIMSNVCFYRTWPTQLICLTC